MVLKNAQHRSFLLEVIAQVNVPGKFIDLAYEVKQELMGAEIIQSKQNDTPDDAIIPVSALGE